MHEIAGGCGRIVTLRMVWADYQMTGRLKTSTADGYWKAIRLGLQDWLDIPVTDISKDWVQARHQKLTTTAPALANQVMRILKALINYARHRYNLNDWCNPVTRLSEVRAWNRIKKRRNVITPAQMPNFYMSILSLHNKVARDYYLVVLFTGLRKMEAASMLWKDVDFENRLITVLDTKNGEDHTLPMSDFLFEVLNDRRKESKLSNPYSPDGSRTRILTTSGPAIQCCQSVLVSDLRFMI